VLIRQGILTTSRKVRKTKNHPEEARGQTVPLTKTEMKRTKKQLAERKAKAAEIAAMYTTVAGGGRLQFRCSKKGWIEDPVGPDLSCDLAISRAIPAPKKPATESQLTRPGGTLWVENVGPRVKGKPTEYREVTIPIKKKP
jgi:hypothetical protein